MVQTTPKRSSMDHTAFNLQRTPCLPLPRKRSSDGASTEYGGEHLIATHYSFIDPDRMKGWVGLVKGKVFPYSLPSVGPGADPGIQAVSLQVNFKSFPGNRLPLLPGLLSPSRQTMKYSTSVCLGVCGLNILWQELKTELDKLKVK